MNQKLLKKFLKNQPTFLMKDAEALQRAADERGSWNENPEEDGDLYVWIRRFESEVQREDLYRSVYETDHWKGNLGPRVGELIDREKISVTRIVPTSKSIIR